MAKRAAKMRRWLAAACLYALCAIIIIGTKPLQVRVADMATAEGDSLRQVLYLAMFFTLLLSSQAYNRPARLLVLPFGMVALLIWCAITTTWAIFPAIAVRRLVLTSLLIWSIFRLVDELGFARTMYHFRIALLLALILNFAAVALSPAAIHQMGERVDPNLTGNWRGFLQHKNYAGQLCAVTILAFVFGGSQWRPWLRAAVIAAATFFLIKSSSKTSINMVFVGIAAGWAFTHYRPFYRSLIVPFIMIAGSALSYMLIMNWDQIIAPIYGSDRSAFTGRVEIWAVMLAYIQDHPLDGAGFGSFWNVGPDGPIFALTSGWVKALGNSHNGYLDLISQTGVQGLIIAVFALIIVPLGRLLANRRIGRAEGAFLAAMLAFFVGHNLTETTVMDRDALGQIMLIFALALISKTVGVSWFTVRESRRRLARSAMGEFGTGASPGEPREDLTVELTSWPTPVRN